MFQIEMANNHARVRPLVNDAVPYNKLVLLDIKPIGTGAFGDVFKAIQKDWDCQVAYKKLDTRFITDER